VARAKPIARKNSFLNIPTNLLSDSLSPLFPFEYPPVMPSVENMAASKENAASIKVLDDLLAKLNISKSQDETNAATASLATFINGAIEESAAPTK
jgi:hypothetical protein